MIEFMIIHLLTFHPSTRQKGTYEKERTAKLAKIIALQIDNFRRIRAAEIRPDGSLVEITGKNGHGKSSVLYAIWTAFKGRAVAGPKPIRIGAEQCTIQAKTDEFTVTRHFAVSPDGEITTSVRVVMDDGRRVASKPQMMLDALLPDLALDPLDFMRRKPREQVDTIKTLVKDFDFEANAAARKIAYENRGYQNKLAKDNLAAAEAVQLPQGKEPAAVDMSGLLVEIHNASQRNAELERRIAKRAEARRDSDRLMDEAEALRARAATYEKQAAELDRKLDEAEPLPAPIDIGALRKAAEEAEENNRIHLKFKDREQRMAMHKQAVHDAAALSKHIENLDQAKRDAIAAAKLPIVGLELGEEMLLLNGLPFEQASTAEKLRASVAIGMSLAPPPSDPGIRIMTIDEASELDLESMKLLAELADKNQYQVWCARIDRTGEQGFVIEDGQLK